MGPDSVAQFLGTWGYPAYAAAFLATSFGSPVTEDLLLLTGGYLVSAGIFSFPVVLPLGYACVLTTDVIIFHIGRLLRTRSLKRDAWIRRLVRPAQLRLATRWFSRFGDLVIFFARLVPGTRLLVFLTAGVRGVPLSRFVLLDGLASLIYVPVTVFVGAKVGERIGDLDHTLTWIGDRALWLLVAIIAVAMLRHAWQRRMRRFVDRTLDPRS